MRSTKIIARRPYFLIFSCLCILLLLSSFKLGALNLSASKKVKFPVISLVPGLTIVDIEQQEYFAVLTLRNDSSRIITAFVLSSSGVILRSEMIGSDRVMTPGMTTVKLCELPSATSPEKGITVLAAAYEDGTSEGEAKFVKQIFDARAGTQAQIERILPLFRDVFVTAKATSQVQKREAMRLKLEQLPEAEEERSLEYRVGLHDEKERAIKSLRELEQVEQERGEDIARQALLHIINRYEKRNLEILHSLKQIR